jgi:hypothetical protein
VQPQRGARQQRPQALRFARLLLWLMREGARHYRLVRKIPVYHDVYEQARAFGIVFNSQALPATGEFSVTWKRFLRAISHAGHTANNAGLSGMATSAGSLRQEPPPCQAQLPCQRSESRETRRRRGADAVGFLCTSEIGLSATSCIRKLWLLGVTHQNLSVPCSRSKNRNSSLFSKQVVERRGR